jgi:hypothetical protein
MDSSDEVQSCLTSMQSVLQSVRLRQLAAFRAALRKSTMRTDT